MAQIQCSFFSYTLEHGTNIYINLPTISPCDTAHSHAVSNQYPVLYLLHGRGNDYLSWPRFTSMARYSEENRIALLTMDTGNWAYMNVENHERYYDFLAHELPEFLAANFPISTNREDSYLAGLSMGGYGTLAHGLSHPESYCAIGAFSPAIHLKKYDARQFSHTIDIYPLVDKLAETPEKAPAIYLSCGTEDSLCNEMNALAKTLKEKNIPVHSESIPGYEHEWSLWDGELLKFLQWIPRTDKQYKLGFHKI